MSVLVLLNVPLEAYLTIYQHNQALTVNLNKRPIGMLVIFRYALRTLKPCSSHYRLPTQGGTQSVKENIIFTFNNLTLNTIR